MSHGWSCSHRVGRRWQDFLIRTLPVLTSVLLIQWIQVLFRYGSLSLPRPRWPGLGIRRSWKSLWDVSGGGVRVRVPAADCACIWLLGATPLPPPPVLSLPANPGYAADMHIHFLDAWIMEMSAIYQVVVRCLFIQLNVCCMILVVETFLFVAVSI